VHGLEHERENSIKLSDPDFQTVGCEPLMVQSLNLNLGSLLPCNQSSALCYQLTVSKVRICFEEVAY